ncbi:MAG TPA: hypothetical protein VMU50_07280 [Polyangia bacterium]|nr:hypothetical protein [Polyangia bacterium]
MRTRTGLRLPGWAFLLVVAPGACGNVTLSNDAAADGPADRAPGSGGAGGAGTGGHGTGGETGSGGSVAGSGGAGGGGTTGTGGGAGGALGTGGAGGGADQCQRDADCPPILCIKAPCPTNLCVLGNDGFHHCGLRQPLALDNCGQGFPGAGCCTSDAQCTMQAHGMCVPISEGTCGGAHPIGNECRYDQCQGDADCSAMPRGVCTGGYPRRCLYGVCRQNSDCVAKPGGTCALAIVGLYCTEETVFCRYPNDPCHSNSDCHAGALQACVPNAGGQGTSCQQQQPPPP